MSENEAMAPMTDSPDYAVSVTINGQKHPVTLHGRPIERFYADWQAMSLEASLLPLPLLILRHVVSGDEAYWFLSRNLDYLGSRTTDLPPEERALLHRAVTPFFQSLARNALTVQHPVAAEEAEKFARMNPVLAQDLLDLWLSPLVPGRCFMPGDMPEEGERVSPDGPMLTGGHVDNLLKMALGLESQPDPIILSPLGPEALRGWLLFARADLALFRFVDPAFNLVFFLGRCGAEPIFFCPRLDLMVTAAPETLARLVPRRMLAAFMRHPDYILTVPANPVVTFGAMHTQDAGQAGLAGLAGLGNASSLSIAPPSLDATLGSVFGASFPMEGGERPTAEATGEAAPVPAAEPAITPLVTRIGGIESDTSPILAVTTTPMPLEGAAVPAAAPPEATPATAPPAEEPTDFTAFDRVFSAAIKASADLPPPEPEAPVPEGGFRYRMRKILRR